MPSRLRGLIGRLVDWGPVDAALRHLEARDQGARDLLAVLTYHRVEEPADVIGHPGLVSASPAQFAEQMAHIAARYRPIAVDDVLEARHGRRAIPPRAVLVTFDDAYLDFAERAWPVMRRHRIPATLFVPTAYPDDAARWFWWDWLHEILDATPANITLPTPWGDLRLGDERDRGAVARRLRGELKGLPHAELVAAVTEMGHRIGCPPPANPVLGWDTLRHLAADGVRLAPHTRTHPILDRMGADELDRELSGSLADLEREIGPTPRALAYPSGANTATVREAASRAGYEIAFTTRRGLNRLGHADWLGLSRINVGQATSVNMLRAQLGRWAVAWSR